MATKLWILIGHGNAGKSTTIGHLTGMWKPPLGAAGVSSNPAKDLQDVPQRGGGLLRMYARRTAYQEAGIDPDKSRDDIERGTRSILADRNALVCLRKDAVNHCPSYKEYLDRWVKANFELVSLVCFWAMATDATPLEWGAPVLFHDAPFDKNDQSLTPALIRVASVRDHFGWA